MKTCIVVAVGWVTVAWQAPVFAQTETRSFGTNSIPLRSEGIPGNANRSIVFPTEPRLTLAQWNGEGIRSEGNLDEKEAAKMPFDAFLSEAGYVVYPIEHNCASLERKIAKSPLVLRKDYIPRRVVLVRRVGPGTEGRMSGREFAVVAEIGSTYQFMVDVRDLHFVQGTDERAEAVSQ